MWYRFSRIIRSTQTYLFPIHLSEEIIPAAIFYATVAPLLTYFVVKKTIIDPMNEAAKQRNIEKVKETNRSRYDLVTILLVIQISQ